MSRRQSGAFTKRQALRLGVERGTVQQRLLDREWVQVYGDVLRAATTPVTAELLAHAGVLAIGGAVAIAGRFGANLLALDRAPGWYEPEFVVPDNRRRPIIAGVLVRRVERATWSVMWRQGLPFAPLPMLLRELAGDVPLHVAREVVQHALRRRLVTEVLLVDQLGRGRSGAAALRTVLEELAPGYQSLWEKRVHRGLRTRGVRLKPQTEVEAPDGRKAFVDLGDDALRFGVEIDGFLNHMARFAADRRRARLLAAELDWTIAPVAVDELVADFEAVMDELARAYALVRRRAA